MPAKKKAFKQILAKKKSIQKIKKKKTKKWGIFSLLSPHNKKIAWFAIKFFVIFFVLHAIVTSIDLSALTFFIAALTASFLGLQTAGNLVIANSSPFFITNSCTGLVSASILAAIIFSLKKPSFLVKCIVFLIGSAAILVANIPRVMLVLYAAQKGFDAELVHMATWFLMSAIVLVIWYYGTKKLAGIKEFSDLL